jgi:hypothetical protein
MESNPKMTPAQLKANLLANAGTAVYSVVSNNDWSANNTLKGGEAKVAYNKFNSVESSKISGLTMTGLSFRII